MLPKLTASQPPSSAHVDSLITYAAAFLANAGNYFTYNDTKFTPSITADDVHAIIKGVGVAHDDDIASTVQAMCTVLPGAAHVGLPPSGVSAYYGPGVSQDAIDAAAKVRVVRLPLHIIYYNNRPTSNWARRLGTRD